MKTPLPDAEYHGESMGNDIFAFTEDMLIAYGEAEYRRAIEDAALWLDLYDGPINSRRAEAIRAMARGARK